MSAIMRKYIFNGNRGLGNQYHGWDRGNGNTISANKIGEICAISDDEFMHLDLDFPGMFSLFTKESPPVEIMEADPPPPPPRPAQPIAPVPPSVVFSPSPIPARMKLGRPPALFSIIISTYNMGHWIIDALNSIFAQSFKNFECIVVDAGSTDNTQEKFVSWHASMAGNDIRFKFMRTQNRVTIGEAWNIGRKAAAGRYGVICNADDWLEPGALQAIADEIAAHDKKIDAIKFKVMRPGLIGRFDYASLDRLGLIYSHAKKWMARPTTNGGEKPEIYECREWDRDRMKKECLPCGLAAFDLEICEEVGGFDESFIIAADWDMWIKISGVSSGLCIQEPLYNYFVHDDSLEHSNLRKCRKEQKYVADRHSKEASVIIPAMRPDCLAAALESMKMTKDCEFEVIVVSGCQAASDAVEKFIGKKRKTPFALRNIDAHWSTVVDALNIGFKAAAGEFVVWLNDDILIQSEFWLRDSMARMKNDGIHLGCLHYRDQLTGKSGTCMTHGALIFANFGCIRKSDLAALGYWDKNYDKYYSDPDFSLTAYLYGLNVREILEANLLHVSPDDDIRSAGRHDYAGKNQKYYNAKWDELVKLHKGQK